MAQRLKTIWRHPKRPGQLFLGLALSLQLAVGAPVLCLVHCLLLPSLHASHHHHHMMMAGGMEAPAVAADPCHPPGGPAAPGGQIGSGQPMPAAIYAAALPPPQALEPRFARRRAAAPPALPSIQWLAPIPGPPPRPSA